MVKFYFASDPVNLGLAVEVGAKRLLCSYHYYKRESTKRRIKDWVSQGLDILIDSGAFSVKHVGASITIEEYEKYLAEMKLDKYIVLDVIYDPVATRKNLEIMEKDGFNPIPVYHFGSDIKYLYELIDKYDYIALGGAAKLHGKKRKVWLDYIWRIILKRKENLKVHGLACSAVETMKRYPWYSADSSTFTESVRFGNINPGGNINNIHIGRWYKMQYQLTGDKRYIEPGYGAFRRMMSFKNNLKPFLDIEKYEWVDYVGLKQDVALF